MSTLAKLGKLTQFRRGDGNTPEVFTLVPEAAGTIELGEESPKVDVTNFDSVRAEFIPDLAEGSMVELEGNFINHAQQVGLRDDVKNGVNRNFQVYHPGFAVTFSFTLACLAWSMSFAPKGAAVKYKFKGQVTGDLVVS
jgi:hypothetical protein